MFLYGKYLDAKLYPGMRGDTAIVDFLFGLVKSRLEQTKNSVNTALQKINQRLKLQGN